MKIAGVQMDVVLGDVRGNIDRIIGRLRETARAGARLAVFPECAVTGYCFESLAEAREFAQPVPGPATEAISKACAELDVLAVFGMLERDGERIFNVAVLVGPNGVIGNYRKVHLPFLGVDRFTTHGDQPFRAHDTGEVRVGLNICYDSAFPEASRCLALDGAELIALPTNWPPSAECVSEHCINARAMENAVYYIAVNRVGEERGFRFIGGSSICDPGGRTLARTRGTDEEIIYADIDPQLARRKHFVRVPGKHEIDRMADRRPDMYGAMVQPHGLRPPGR